MRCTDDIIQYLSPTLERHKGCTLVDIHPGACLFSSKLHDYLKPKQHILLEPDETYYEPFIKPLLDHPGSAYVHAALRDPNHAKTWTNYRQLHVSEMLSDHTQLDNTDPRRRELDPSLLVVGNLARRYNPKHFAQGRMEFAPLALYQMGYDALAKEFLQRNGMVRMLWWVPELYKPTSLGGRLPYTRSSFNVGLGISANISEVAGVSPVDMIIGNRKPTVKIRKRWDATERAISHDVGSASERKGMNVPGGRALQERDPAPLEPGETFTAVSPFSVTISNEADLRTKIAALSARLTNMAKFLANKGRVSAGISMADRAAALSSLEYPQSALASKHMKTEVHSNFSEHRGAVLLDLGLVLINLEASFKELEDRLERTTLNELREEVLSLGRTYNRLLESASDRTAITAIEILEDQVGFFLSPRLLPLDRREYEPLQAETADFWPKYDLALFDMVPTGTDLSVPDLASSREASDFCAELVKTLFGATSQPVPLALDRIGVNAGKDLIPLVPAITDPRRGGRLNPMDVKVRMLTDEMIVDLVKAFFEWPFRPQSWELALANGDVAGSSEVEDPLTV